MSKARDIADRKLDGTDLTLGDNDKAVFGAGSDLQIYHDGTSSIIQENGIGALYLQGSHLYLNNTAGTQSYLTCVDGGATTLYSAGNPKLATTSTGVDVTGTVTADGLTVGGTATLRDSIAPYVKFEETGIQDTYLGVDSGNLFIRQGTLGFNSLNISSGNDISFYEDTGTTAKFFWDASAESLGIGTSSPNCGITVSKSGVDGINLSYSAGPDSPRLFFTNDTPSEGIAIVNGAGSLKFNVGGAIPGSSSGTEAARIDTSGNLLVGKTTTNYNLSGLQLFNAGYLHATATPTTSTSPVITVNRLSTDGAIAEFKKDGAPVGSIGVEGNDLWIGNTNAGLQFIDNTVGNRTIRPFNPSTNSKTDDSTDLGQSTCRFQDLYLSGGVYLGGTGAANKLEDYEEGTWTGVLKGGTTVGNSPSATGTYTKVGNLVTVVCRFTNLDTTGATGQFQIHGLPFAAISGPAVTSSVWNNRTSTTGGMIMEIPNGNTQANAYDSAGSTKNWLSSGVTYVGFTAVYRAA